MPVGEAKQGLGAKGRAQLQGWAPLLLQGWTQGLRLQQGWWRPQQHC